MKFYIFFLALSFLVSSNAFARRVECDREQKQCAVTNSNYTFNDKVVFINDDNEVVAVGEVKKIYGKKRYIKITKAFGRVSSRDTVQLMDARVGSVGELKKVYKVFVPKPEYVVGGSAGFVTFNVGEFLSGYDLTGLLQKKHNQYLDWVGRLGMTLANGKISPNNTGVIEDPIEMMAFSFLGGVSTEIFRKYKASVRGEVDLGLAYVSASVDGDAGLISGEGYNSKMKNGIGLGGRVEASIQYDMSEQWEMGLNVGISRIHNAQGTVIGINVSKRLD